MRVGGWGEEERWWGWGDLLTGLAYLFVSILVLVCGREKNIFFSPIPFFLLLNAKSSSL